MLIEDSFDFIYDFINIYTKYCVSNYDVNSPANISLKLEKAYVDLAYIVYHENFKAFNHSVGSKGISDLSSIINSYFELL